MSTALAILAVTGLYAALFAPLLFLAWKSVAAVPVAAGYAGLLVVATSLHSGLLVRPDLPDNLSQVSTSAVSMAQCREVLTLLDRAGAIIDRAHPPRLVVAQDQWSQLPEEGQRVIVECVERGWPSGSGPAQLEVRAR